jgi:hypothetical protein
MTELREAFFRDLARHLVLWRDSLVEAIANPASAGWSENGQAAERLHAKGFTEEELGDLRRLSDECFRGILHSTLVTIDGGSALADVGNLALVNATTGEVLSEGGLHEEFAEYLAEHDLL